MIKKEVLQSLSEQEMDMLLYIVNKISPPGFDLQIDENLLSTYKLDALLNLCSVHKDKVKEEYIKIYDSMLSKLNGTYKEEPKPEIKTETEAAKEDKKEEEVTKNENTTEPPKAS